MIDNDPGDECTCDTCTLNKLRHAITEWLKNPFDGWRNGGIVVPKGKFPTWPNVEPG